MGKLKERLLEKFVQPLEPQEEERFDKIHVASCVLLLEVAKSDYEFSSIEKTAIEAIMRNEFQIPAEDVEELLEIARKSRNESIDLWEFTDLINRNFSREEKRHVIEAVWKVIYADQKLDKYEDHLVHKLTRLFNLDHDELIKAKLKVLYGQDIE
ncbi:MAG: TerB family tellurite resistance protein [Candidatus Aminicenantes bacterium]|nr:TerB family tellurite resistance protein [Candidatus Aminicenantes bacterium]